jgi:hypothetical protein
MPQINGTSAASILGISSAQVLYLKNAGALKDLKTTVPGARHHEPAYDLDRVLALREQYPNPQDLLNKYYRKNASASAGAARMSGCTNAAIMARLDQITATLAEMKDTIATIERNAGEIARRPYVNDTERSM